MADTAVLTEMIAATEFPEFGSIISIYSQYNDGPEYVGQRLTRPAVPDKSLG